MRAEGARAGSGDLLFVSGRVSRTRGEVGTDLTTKQGQAAVQLDLVLRLGA